MRFQLRMKGTDETRSRESWTLVKVEKDVFSATLWFSSLLSTVPRLARPFSSDISWQFFFFLFRCVRAFVFRSSSLRIYTTTRQPRIHHKRLSRSTFVRIFSPWTRLYSTASFRLNVVVSPGAASSDVTFIQVSYSTDMVITVHRTSKGQRRDSSGSGIHSFPDIVFWTMGAFQVELSCHMDLSGVWPHNWCPIVQFHSGWNST